MKSISFDETRRSCIMCSTLVIQFYYEHSNNTVRYICKGEYIFAESPYIFAKLLIHTVPNWQVQRKFHMVANLRFIHDGNSVHGSKQWSLYFLSVKMFYLQSGKPSNLLKKQFVHKNGYYQNRFLSDILNENKIVLNNQVNTKQLADFQYYSQNYYYYYRILLSP